MLIHCISENNTPFSGIISKKPQSSKDDANSNEPSQDMTTSDQCDTAPFLQNDPSRKHFEESFVLLCCKDAIRTYATKSVVHVSLFFHCFWFLVVLCPWMFYIIPFDITRGTINLCAKWSSTNLVAGQLLLWTMGKFVGYYYSFRMEISRLGKLFLS